jgi:hypothetical protein
MATKNKRLRPISQAQHRRSVLPWYFDLSSKGLFLLIILAASLLALLALAQTGRVVGVGYRLKALQEQEADLIWEQEEILQEIAREADPAVLDKWAKDQGMEEIEVGDVVFLTVPADPVLELDKPASMAQEP